MNTVHVIVEGTSDQVLLKKLVNDLETTVQIRFHVAGGKPSAHTLARTLQVRLEEPVALVLDADTNDNRMAEEEQSMYESYLNFSSKGVPFTVILVRPCIEAIFFETPEIFSDITGKQIESKYILVGKAAPKQCLRELEIDWLRLLPTLNEQRLQVLRAFEPIARLRQFLLNVTNSISADTQYIPLLSQRDAVFI